MENLNKTFFDRIKIWLLENCETSQARSFVSTKVLADNYNQFYKNNEIDLNNIKSFGVVLGKVIKQLSWNIEKTKLNNVRGYYYLKLK